MLNIECSQFFVDVFSLKSKIWPMVLVSGVLMNLLGVLTKRGQIQMDQVVHWVVHQEGPKSKTLFMSA